MPYEVVAGMTLLWVNSTLVRQLSGVVTTVRERVCRMNLKDSLQGFGTGQHETRSPAGIRSFLREYSLHNSCLFYFSDCCRR